MKSLVYALFAVLLLSASCSGNGTSEQANDDSARMADSIAKVEAAKAEQARLDSLRQDSIAKAEELAKATAQYDDLVSQFVSSVNNIEKAGKKGDFSNMHSLVNKYTSLRSKINKVKSNLSPEQLSKVKKAEKKFGKLINGVIAA